MVVEGIDGAGKNTMVAALTAALTDAGATVRRVAFPRYGADVHADLIADGLHGRLGDLGDSVHGMALLFALDRRAAAPDLRAQLAACDVLLVDRYIASNAAYAAARLGQDAGGEVVEWVRGIEVDRFAIPVPDAQVLLRVATDVAAERALRRERADVARARDTWEVNDQLQERTGAVYAQLADRSWLSPWHVVDAADDIDAGALVAALR